MTDHAEVRPVATPPEFRSEENGTRLVATGVAMAYGERSRTISTPADGRFREQFEPRSFARTLPNSDVRAHLEHRGPFLGRTGSGTLRLHDDDVALRYELDLPDTTAGRDAAVLLERRDVAGSSIGFRAIPSKVDWTVDDEGMALRTVGEAVLVFVDLTVAPAYPASTAESALRSLAVDLGVDVRSLLDAPNLGAMIAGGTPPPTDEHDPPGSGHEPPAVPRPAIAGLCS